jgi:hypothetical protein
VTEDHRFIFDDGDAARLKLIVKSPTPKQKAILTVEAGLKPGDVEPASAKAARALLGRSGRASLGSIKLNGQAVDVRLAVPDEGDAQLTAVEARTALEALLKDLGGLTEAGLAALRRERERAAALAGVADTPADLLAKLDAAKDKLLRYEKVFVETFRTAVAASSVLDGQRLEAVKILKRLGAT